MPRCARLGIREDPFGKCSWDFKNEEAMAGRALDTGRGKCVGEDCRQVKSLMHFHNQRMAENTWGSQLVSFAGPHRPLPIWFGSWKISAGEDCVLLFCLFACSVGRKEAGGQGGG